jgi:hypothetical protein
MIGNGNLLKEINDELSEGNFCIMGTIALIRVMTTTARTPRQMMTLEK